MERTTSTSNAAKTAAKVNEEEKVYTWKNPETAGSLRWNHKIIKPGQKFTAKKSEIPSVFINTLIQLSEYVSDEKVAVIPGATASYTLKEREGEEDMWDVVNNKGKVINETGLSHEAASKLLKDLSE